MCVDCGCSDGTAATLFDPQTGVSRSVVSGDEFNGIKGAVGDDYDDRRSSGSSDPRSHTHSHDHNHDETPHGTTIEVGTRILAKNDSIAEENRLSLERRNILTLNLMSSPGSGKTTLLECTIEALVDLPVTVIEGDQATANDAERIRKAGAPVIQVNTGSGCHLDAEMIKRALVELNPPRDSVLFIENVGNLVCPAAFDLGERAKIVLFSTTEGEDKPLKYPQMFNAATLVLLTKIDLVPYLDFSVSQALANIHRVNSNAEILEISTRTGVGVAEWCRWLHAQFEKVRQRGSSENPARI